MSRFLPLIGLATVVVMTSSCSGATQTRAITARPLEGGSWSYASDKSTIEFMLQFEAVGLSGGPFRQEASVWRDGKSLYIAGLFIDISDGNTFGRKDDFRAKAAITSIEPGTYTVIDAFDGQELAEINTASGHGTLFRARE